MLDFLKRGSKKGDNGGGAHGGGLDGGASKKDGLRGLGLAEQVASLMPEGARKKAPDRGTDRANGDSKAAKSKKKDDPEAERQREVLEAAHDIGNQDVIFEQLAHHGATKSMPGDLLARWGFREAGAVNDAESGFRAVLYVPTAEVLAGQTERAQIARSLYGGAPPPVLAFRGTQEKRGMQDDTNREGIGTYQFESNVGRISQMFGAAGGKCVVAGHSLGGALAQLAAARFPSSVSRVVTFQAPAVNEQAAEKVKQHNAESAPEDQIHSTHYRMHGDLVHKAGAKLTEGDVYTFESKGVGNPMDHLNFPLARLAAARGSMIPGVTGKGRKEEQDTLTKVTKQSSDEAKSGPMARMAEGGRKLFGGLVRDESMETYVKVWRDVEMMCKAGQFTEKYVRNVIDINDQLKPEQKTKMRDQVAILYQQLPQTAQPAGDQGQAKKGA